MANTDVDLEAAGPLQVSTTLFAEDGGVVVGGVDGASGEGTGTVYKASGNGSGTRKASAQVKQQANIALL